MSVSFANSIGPFAIGAFFACFLSGVVGGLGARYYKLFPAGKDKPIFRYTVQLLLFFDVFTTACACGSVWLLCVKNFGNLSALSFSPVTFAINPAVTGFVTLIVQIFYAHRVWVIGKKNLIVPILIVTLGVAQMGFAIGASITAFTLPTTQYHGYTWGVLTWLLCATAGDFIIVGAIGYHLRNARKLAGFDGTRSLITKIVLITIETNLLTTVVAMMDSIVFAKVASNVHVAFNVSLAKLYCISFLYSLTERANYGGSNGEDSNRSHQVITNKPSGFTAGATHFKSLPNAIARQPVTVHVTMESDPNNEREDEEWGSSKGRKQGSEKDSDL